MSRIQIYENDNNLQLGDKWIGTDQTGDITKNYTLESVRDFIVDGSTGDILVNNPDEEDITVIDGKLKFKDRDASGFQKGYKIIRADFDWSTAPASYANSIWEIRYEFDLLGAAITLPDSVCLKFNGGFISNYTSIAALNGKSTVNEAEGFDGSGSIDPTWIFGEIFDTDDRIKLDGIQDFATITDLGYNASPTTGEITNSGGANVTLPLSDAFTSGLIEPINTMPIKSNPVGSDIFYVEDSEDSNSKKQVNITDFQSDIVVIDLSYTESPTDGVVVSSNGTPATIPARSELNASLMLAADTPKINSIRAGAEPNVHSDWTATSGPSEILNKPIVK